MKVYHIRSLEQLKPYQKMWDHILDVNQNDNPFIEFQWIENWWKYLGRNRGVEIIVVEKADNVIAFFPLQITHMMKSTVIEFLGRGEAHYMDIVVYDDEREQVIQYVFDELMESMPKCIFNLHGLLSSSPTTNMLSLYLAKRKCEPTIFSIVTPFVKTDTLNLEDYLKKRSKIHGLNRREKRLRYLGHPKVMTSNPDEIEQVFTLHDKRWRKMDETNFTDEEHQMFYSALLNCEDGPMKAKVEGLYLDDQMIAFSYVFKCRGRHVGYLNGHDPDYSLYGPGTILDKELITRSQNNNDLRIYDLSSGYEPYKFDWNTGVDYTNNFLFSSNEWQTQMVFQLIKGKGYVKEILKKNYKVLLFKNEFLGKNLHFFRNASFRDWVKAFSSQVGKIYSKKSVEIYQQKQGTEDSLDYQILIYPEARKRHHDLKQTNKWFYNGFTPYGDTNVSMFWVHPNVIRVDEVDYLQELPKNSAYIAEWQIHKLSSVCSFLRQDNGVQDIFLHTTKKDEVTMKHLQQLGFTHVSSIKKRNLLFKPSTQVLTNSTSKQ